MKLYQIQETINTPAIYFDHQNGQLKITGRCMSENAAKFFQPIYDWLDEYIAKPHNETVLTFKLEYYNTTASLYLIKIIRKLERLLDNGNKVLVKWFFEKGDMDMEEDGNHFKSLTTLEMMMIAYSN